MNTSGNIFELDTFSHPMIWVQGIGSRAISYLIGAMKQLFEILVRIDVYVQLATHCASGGHLHFDLSDEVKTALRIQLPAIATRDNHLQESGCYAVCFKDIQSICGSLLDGGHKARICSRTLDQSSRVRCNCQRHALDARIVAWKRCDSRGSDCHCFGWFSDAHRADQLAPWGSGDLGLFHPLWCGEHRCRYSFRCNPIIRQLREWFGLSRIGCSWR
jgi:hypothetical protein